MKKCLFTVSLALATGMALAQEYPQQLSISRSIIAGDINEQKAIESITANNDIDRGASVVYKAGKSITLQAGFVARPGSVFAATITPVASSRLKGDVPGLSAMAYPNPFVNQTTIDYNLPVSGRVRHTLLDSKGQVLRQTEDEVEQSAGPHKAQLEGGGMPIGTYLYQIQVGNESRTLRLLKKE